MQIIDKFFLLLAISLKSALNLTVEFCLDQSFRQCSISPKVTIRALRRLFASFRNFRCVVNQDHLDQLASQTYTVDTNVQCSYVFMATIDDILLLNCFLRYQYDCYNKQSRNNAKNRCHKIWFVLMLIFVFHAMALMTIS